MGTEESTESSNGCDRQHGNGQVIGYNKVIIIHMLMPTLTDFCLNIDPIAEILMQEPGRENELNDVRYIYIPELVIRMHNVLYETRHITGGYVNECEHNCSKYKLLIQIC